MQKYKVIKYSQWWYGILNTETNIMLRVGPNPNYDGPLDDKENKLLLFKSKDKAQEYINQLVEEDTLIESFLDSIPTIEAKWDPEREVYILPKEEYEDWDEISPKAFYSLYLPNADNELKEEATEILARWYEKERLDYDDRSEFLDFVKKTVHDKIMNCRVLEEMNTIWKVIDESQIKIGDN